MAKESVINTTSSAVSLIDMLKVKEVKEEKFFDFGAINAIVDSFFPILHDIQGKFNYLPKEGLKRIALRLNSTLSQVLETVEIIEETMLEQIFSLKGNKPRNLIPILQAVQKQFGYLSQVSMMHIAEHLKMSLNEAYGVASFYTQFKFQKPGKNKISLCSGTACFVKGGSVLVKAVENNLGIEANQTTEDGLFTFETVACLGCCAISPSMIINDNIHGKMTPKKLIRLLDSIKKKA
ncbi:MAG: NADH-quinone oxidoreductase subunit NuoE family protein [Candidatus Hodarchaeales archaeon]